MRRWIAGILLSLLVATIFCVTKRSETSSSVPLFLEHQTFLDGIGMHRLGKNFLLRYSQDRRLFSAAKETIKKERRAWREGQKTVIPLVIHSVWLSKEPFPSELEQAVSSVQQNHPHCQSITWSEEDVLKLMSDKEREVWNTIPLQLRKDVAAALILYHKGGVVIDPAIQSLIPFREIFSAAEWIVSLEPPLPHAHMKRHLWLSTTFLAATPHHPLSKAWLNGLFEYFQKSHTGTSVLKQYFEGILLPLHQVFLSERAKSEKTLALPPTSFIPIAPPYIHSYLTKLFGEGKEDKQERHFFTFHLDPPFSKVARDSLGLHVYGGRMGELFHKDKKQKNKV